MVKKVLVNELIEDGATPLQELDRRDFAVDAMFWVDLPDRDYWQLVTAPPVVRAHGSAAADGKLQDILRGIDLSGFALEDITLLEPDSQQFRALRSVAETSHRLAVGSSWVVFEDAIVYRWTSASVTAELNCEISSERLEEVWDAYRKPISLSVPSLLFGVVGRRVTLRFHPQHGPQRQIAGIKTAFQIALHRDDAFPNCEVTWLD